MANKRLIDANALCDAMYDEEFQTFVPLDEICSVIDKTPTIDAVPFATFAGVCEHGHIACVNLDKGTYTQVCGKNIPKGQSWGTCSFETCPFVVRNQDGGASE